MAAVLVLNATNEPVSTTTVWKALLLIDSGQAVLLEKLEGQFLRSATARYVVPRVIRVLRYIKMRRHMYTPATWTRTGVLRRDNFLCGYCGEPANTIDHVVPRCRGGRDEWKNTVACCWECNQKKGASSLEQAGMVLLHPLFVPTEGFFLQWKWLNAHPLTAPC